MHCSLPLLTQDPIRRPRGKALFFPIINIETDNAVAPPQFEGTIKPAVGDGYWSYIPPPAPGQHVLKFRSANANDLTLDVTYNLTVA